LNEQKDDEKAKPKMSAAEYFKNKSNKKGLEGMEVKEV